MLHRQVCRQNAHTYKIKINLLKVRIIKLEKGFILLCEFGEASLKVEPRASDMLSRYLSGNKYYNQN